MQPVLILLVDDSPETISTSVRALESSGENYTFRSAYDGIEALRQIGESTPDLIITDWDMPEMNGIELIKNIRISERFREIPIIMVTGMMVSAENLKEAFEAGATDYLKKPFNKVELNARVKSVLLLTSAIKEVKLVHAEILEGKKRELVATSIKLVQMSELNSKLLDDLNSMIDDFSDETKEKIDSIISRYNLNSLDSTWKEFETRFGNVYEDFYEKLGRSHLGLTLNEKRLSALLKLGFNTKAIAALTFQEAKSVDMARYRLRKKLDLAPDVNLSEYLMNF